MFNKNLFGIALIATLVYAFVSGLLSYLVQKNFNMSQTVAGGLVFFVVFYLIALVLWNKKDKE